MSKSLLIPAAEAVELTAAFIVDSGYLTKQLVCNTALISEDIKRSAKEGRRQSTTAVLSLSSCHKELIEALCADLRNAGYTVGHTQMWEDGEGKSLSHVFSSW